MTTTIKDRIMGMTTETITKYPRGCYRNDRKEAYFNQAMGGDIVRDKLYLYQFYRQPPRRTLAILKDGSLG